MNERIAAKSYHSIDDEVRIIQQENTINPLIAEGKRVFGFDIGVLLGTFSASSTFAMSLHWVAH